MGDNKQQALRITFDAEDLEFMKSYKETYGASQQWFVEQAVKEKIQLIKLKQELGEL